MIEKMNLHYSFTNPASVHDEESLTALELAGRQGAKINEVIEDQNTLRFETEQHLSEQDADIKTKFDSQDKVIADGIAEQNRVITAKFSSQDKKIDDRLNVQDEAITNIREVTVPEDVYNEVQKQITGGTFDKQIDESLGGLKERVDNLLGSMEEGGTTLDAELIDSRVDFTGEAHDVAGNSIRAGDTYVMDTSVAMNNFIQSQIDFTQIDTLPLDVSIESGYISKLSSDEGGVFGLNDASYSHTDYIDIFEHPELIITASASYKSCIVSLYDSNQAFIGAYGHNDGVSGDADYTQTINFVSTRFTLIDALNINPKTRFIRVSSINNKEFALSVSEPVKAVKDSSVYYNSSEYEMDEDLMYKDAEGKSQYYINKNTGALVTTSVSGCCSVFIPIENLYMYKVTSGRDVGVYSLLNYYDENYAYIGCNSGSESVPSDNPTIYTDIIPGEVFDIPAECRYVRFSFYGGIFGLMRYKKYTIEEVVKELKNVNGYSNNVFMRPYFMKHNPRYKENPNVLYDKNVLFYGDSFTEGNFTGFVDENGNTGKNSPVIYDSAWGGYKTYPYWVGLRNGAMDTGTWTNFAISGSTMALTKGVEVDGVINESLADDRSPFVWTFLTNDCPIENYDADYIILSYGLNDMYHTDLGAIDDMRMGTFYGAWNYTFKTLLTKKPTVKIGVIIPNANMSEPYRNAIIECCEKWGIPYLDLLGDKTISSTLGKIGMCEEADTIRKNAFQVSADNYHPNHIAHEYMSTYVEDFIRRI